MKVATILPAKYLHHTEGDSYHMCLAHLIRSKDDGIDDYTRFYTQVGRSKDKYLIMDNGVIEGDRRPIWEIVKKAIQVKADEIILPDVLYNCEESLKIGYDALREVKDNFNFKIMTVPQGKTMDEWLECALAMIDWDIDCLGIPKSLVNIAGQHARLAALEFLGNRTRGLDIHLLGCWKTPLEITLIESAARNGTIPKVRGVDSAIAYVYTKAGIEVDSDDRPNVKFEFHEEDADEHLLVQNIKKWREAADIGGIDDISKL